MLSRINKCIITTQTSNIAAVLSYSQPDQLIYQDMEILRNQLILFIQNQIGNTISLYSDPLTEQSYRLDISYILTKIMNIVSQSDMQIQLYFKKEDIDLLLNLLQYIQTLNEDVTEIQQQIYQILYFATYNSIQCAIWFNFGKYVQLVKCNSDRGLDNEMCLSYIILTIHNCMNDITCACLLIQDVLFDIFCRKTIKYIKSSNDYNVLEFLCALINLMITDLLYDQQLDIYAALYQKLQQFLLPELVEIKIPNTKNQSLEKAVYELSGIYNLNLMYTQQQILDLISWSQFFYRLAINNNHQIIQFILTAKTIDFTVQQLSYIDSCFNKIIQTFNFDNRNDIFTLYALEDLQLNEYVQQRFLEWLINVNSSYKDILLIIDTLTKVIAAVQNCGDDIKNLYKSHIQYIVHKIQDALQKKQMESTENNYAIICNFCIEIIITYDTLITNQDIDLFINQLKQFSEHVQKDIIKQLKNIIKERDQQTYL